VAYGLLITWEKHTRKEERIEIASKSAKQVERPVKGSHLPRNGGVVRGTEEG